MATTVEGIEGLKSVEGQHLGYSQWIEITQEMVNTFADATGDHQWIHVDVERSTAGPFGGPIAHGYLTLSLTPRLLPEVLVAQGFSMGVNYGAEKIRFPSAVPVGSKLRMGAELTQVGEVPGGAQCTITVTFEVEGASKPSCVAAVIFRYFT
jgi:acyl dehydratase